jgi:hypothetical protein
MIVITIIIIKTIMIRITNKLIFYILSIYIAFGTSQYYQKTLNFCYPFILFTFIFYWIK